MKTYGEKMVKRDSVLQTTCDNCRRVADGDPDDWVHLSWGHGDWGNDSIESGDIWDACSATCLMALIRRAVADYEPRSQPNPTLWMSIDTFHVEIARGLAQIGVDDV